MKKNIFYLVIVCAVFLITPELSFAQNRATNIVNVQELKIKWPENGTPEERDSLLSIYVENVVKKNEHIVSHREYAHFFTGDNHDYLVIEEYKDMDGLEASFRRTTELENQAWPDETKRKEFFKLLDSYFENWHGDHLYRMNPKLSKN